MSDALQALLDWLGKAESYLTEDQPVLGDLDTVTMLLEQHKVCAIDVKKRSIKIKNVKKRKNMTKIKKFVNVITKLPLLSVVQLHA